MFERIRFVLPAIGLTAAAVLSAAPTAHAAAVSPPGIYTDFVAHAVYSYDGSGPLTDITPSGSGLGRRVQPWDAAVSPDGRTLYTLVSESPTPAGNTLTVSLVVQDPTTGAVRRVITPIGTAGANDVLHLALSADGATAFVMTPAGIYRVAVSSGSVSGPLAAANARAMAVSPDGQTLYVSAGNELKALDAHTGAVKGSVSLGQPAGAIKLSADGRAAYVVGDTTSATGGAALFKVALPAMTISDHVALPVTARQTTQLSGIGIGLSPDQRLLYVVGDDPTNHRAIAVPVQAATLTLGSAVTLYTQNGETLQNDVAFTPDGRFAYTYVGTDQAAHVMVIDVATNTPTEAPFRPDNGITSVVSFPAPPPVASFRGTSHCAGTATAFDASASHASSGTIVRYAWNFGDGSTAVTTSGKTSHVYAKAGRYAASVTVTDSTGTSTTVVFDGQTVLRNGGPSAVAHHTITVGACTVPAPGPQTPAGTPTAESSDSLPMTGSDTGAALAVAGLLVGAGAGLLRVGRRRRTPSAEW